MQEVKAMERVIIGSNFANQPTWKKFIGVPLIYLPIITTVPFVLIGVILVRTHLKFVGGMNIRPYRDFVPAWISHRYHWGNQIIYSTGATWHNLRAYRFYWIFNCKLYCPLSVGLFRYASYLVMIVENWWCPFGHDKKETYREAAIDKSYWHLHFQERQRLHPEDRDNPIWNDETETKA
jgi:hypothetical protein